MLPLLLLLAGGALEAQAPLGPDVAAQKAAMKKLEFLVGKWSGDASIHTPQGVRKIRQTEQVEYRLGGLVLLVEGTGKDPGSGEVVFNALATISYDDTAKSYRIRAFNAGRYLDTELRAESNAFEWGFTSGPAKVRNVMKLNEAGEWVEYGEVTIGDRPPMRTVEFTVRK
ncbi:MAG: DUF1579 family protein [Bryobacterales bacterium]|nr:DUF1579 family protein [Bryobacterales bacterium]